MRTGRENWPAHIWIGLVIMGLGALSSFYGNKLQREQNSIARSSLSLQQKGQQTASEPPPKQDQANSPTPEVWSFISSTLLVVGLVVTLGIFFWRTKKSQLGLVIESAQWYCTRKRKAQRDVTRDIQGMVRENGLFVHAHDSVFGDVCMDHGGPGDPKTLEIELSYHLRMSRPHTTDGLIYVVRRLAPNITANFRPCPSAITKNYVNRSKPFDPIS